MSSSSQRCAYAPSVMLAAEGLMPASSSLIASSTFFLASRLALASVSALACFSMGLPRNWRRYDQLPLPRSIYVPSLLEGGLRRAFRDWSTKIVFPSHARSVEPGAPKARRHAKTVGVSAEDNKKRPQWRRF